MPSTFPNNAFNDFTKFAMRFFPPLLSNENLEDPLERRNHAAGALQAVRYRYFACSRLNEEFKTLFSNAKADARFNEWSEGDEHHLQLEQCIYHFFINALSVFESLVYCLYFVGGAIDKEHFKLIQNPRNITLKTTIKAFKEAFPKLSLANHLCELRNDTDFDRIDKIRNILAHRLVGRRNIRSSSTPFPDGTYTESREETWHIPGFSDRLVFDNELTQRHFDGVTRMLALLIAASNEFLKEVERPKVSDV